MKIPRFKSEKQEADWWYRNRRKVEAELARAKGNGLTPAQIVERETRTKSISIRLAIGDIERAKEQAKASRSVDNSPC